MGTLLVAFLTIPLLVVTYFILRLMGIFSQIYKILALKLGNYLFWGHIKEVIFEAYSAICMCVLLNLNFVSLLCITLFSSCSTLMGR